MDSITRVKTKAEELLSKPFSRDSSQTNGVVSLDEEGSVNRVTDTDYLYKLLRKSPEVLSLQQAMIDDVIGPEVHFEYLGESSGERKRKEARRFYENQVKEQWADALLDVLNAGDGYLWMDIKDMDEARAHIYQEHKSRFNHDENAAIAATKLAEEMKNEGDVVGKPVDIQMVPASTVEHKINKYGEVLEYHQEVNGGHEANFDPESIVHFGYLNLNGGTYNFTPMRSIVSELQILANSKDHNGKIFDNAAIVNKHFNLPEDGPDSQNYKRLVKAVKAFRKSENAHRDLITTGNVETEDLNSIGENMRFKELAEYLTKVLVMAWGVPPTRIGMSIDGDSGARATSLTHQGYFKRVKRLQDKWTKPLNKQLWEPFFNVRMHIGDPDVQTEIKEADRDLRETDVALKRMASGVWDRRAAMDYLDVPEEDRADLEDEEDQAIMEMAAQVSSGRNQQLSELSVFGDRADEEQAEDQERVKEES